jgi:hypothetical protein
MSSATRLNPKNMKPEPKRPRITWPVIPSTVAAIGLLPSWVAAGFAAALAGLADVSGVDEIPGRAGEPVAANGVETVGMFGVGVLTLKPDPGTAATATLEPPRAIVKTFLLGLLGGIHKMISEPAV